MLDLMRKHASSWMIKLILGAIIVSFVLFFGWSQISRSTRGAGGVPEGHPVATVNKAPISGEIFQFYFDRNMERLEDTFKGESVPESFQNFAKVLTLQQLIRRQLLLNTISNLGVYVPDGELADVIRKDIAAMRGGEFDPVFYRQQFLPYFENRYGLNYEDLMRQDVSIGIMESLFQNMGSVPTTEKEKSLFTFELVSIIPAKLTEQKIIADETEALKLAESFIATPPEKWEKLASENKTDIEEIGPLKISERNRIFGQRGTFEDFEEVFTLNKEKPIIKSPIKRGDTIFVVRLVEKKTSPLAAEDKSDDNFLNQWIQSEMADAKIVNYLQTETKQ